MSARAAARRTIGSLPTPSSSVSVIANAIRPAAFIAGRRRIHSSQIASLPKSSTPTSRTSDPLYIPTHPLLRPTPPSALAALCSRVGLGSDASPELLRELERCMIDESWISGGGAASILAALPSNIPQPPTGAVSTGPTTSADAIGQSNTLLANLGNTLLGLFTTEHLSTLYPFLPTRALQAAVSGYAGPSSLASLGRELGLGVSSFGQGLTPDLRAREGSKSEAGRVRRGGVHEVQGGVPIKWMRREEGLEVVEGQGHRGGRKRANRWEDVVAGVVRSIVGLIYQEQGLHQARNFVRTHLLSRHLDLSTILSFREPKKVLAWEVRRLIAGRAEVAIESRILAESGRYSISPIFNVGLFLPSGLKLAEGYGSSLKMADHRAAVNALMSIYTVRGERLAEGGMTFGTDGDITATTELGVKAIGSEGVSRVGAGQFGVAMPTSTHGDAELERIFKPSVALLGKSESLWGSKGGGRDFRSSSSTRESGISVVE